MFARAEDSHRIGAAPGLSAHHLDGPLPQVALGDQPLLVADVEALLGECADDGVVAQQWLGGVALQDEAPGPAVRLRRQQQAHHWRFDVLLLVLVPVEGLPQVGGDAVCKGAEAGGG